MKGLCLMLGLLLGACNVTKYLKPGETLYTGAEVKVKSDKPVNKKEIRKQLESVLRPKPNYSGHANKTLVLL